MTKKAEVVDEWLEAGRWYRVTRYEVCCDCGLVHKVGHRVRGSRAATVQVSIQEAGMTEN